MMDGRSHVFKNTASCFTSIAFVSVFIEFLTPSAKIGSSVFICATCCWPPDLNWYFSACLTSCPTSVKAYSFYFRRAVLPISTFVWSLKTMVCFCWGGIQRRHCPEKEPQHSAVLQMNSATMNSDYILKCLGSILCNYLDPRMNKWFPNASLCADWNSDLINKIIVSEQMWKS